MGDATESDGGCDERSSTGILQNVSRPHVIVNIPLYPDHQLHHIHTRIVLLRYVTRKEKMLASHHNVFIAE